MNNSISWFEDYIIRVLKEAEYNIVAHDSGCRNKGGK